MVTLEQLHARVPHELRPVSVGPVGRQIVRGVHISELVDPTPYLEGGELLLTTGIPFAHDAGYDSYVRRLADRSVAALGLGLGEGIDEVDGELERACERHGVDLFVVPREVPFLRISYAYWELVSLGERADLSSSLRIQTTLADAAVQTDAPTAIVRKLAESLGGWVAYQSFDESRIFTHPTSRKLVSALGSQMSRLRALGPHSSATFPLAEWTAIGHTVMDGGRAAGFLTVATLSPAAHPDRQVLLTAATLLSGVERLRFERRQEVERSGHAITELVVAGHAAAARMLAPTLAVGLTSFVRVAALRGGGVSTASACSLAHAVGALESRDPDTTIATAIAATPFSLAIGAIRILLLPSNDPGSTVSPGVDAPPDPRVMSAVVSLPVSLEGVPAVVERLVGLVATAATGSLVVDHPVALSARAIAWLEVLEGHPQQQLLPTLRSYLAHRGHWASSARDLGIHRNSLRNRIDTIAGVLGVELDEVDVATDLWIALRDRPPHSALPRRR